MFIYHYRLFDKYEMPICSLAVLGDGRPGWHPSIYRHETWGCECTLRFPTFKLDRLRPQINELERSSNPFGPVIAAHLHSQDHPADSRSRGQIKIRLIRRLADNGFDRKTIQDLLRLIDWILHQSQDQEELFLQKLEFLMKEKKMPYLTSWERKFMERGLKKGLERGLQQGRELGLEQGPS